MPRKKSMAELSAIATHCTGADCAFSETLRPNSCRGRPFESESEPASESGPSRAREPTAHWAVREYLANLGMDPQRIKTVTYGASRPADPGHNEAAWSKNRRGDLGIGHAEVNSVLGLRRIFSKRRSAIPHFHGSCTFSNHS
ncbi:MAG TPA: hypothetical protein VFC44_19075 [Candidatus Saccharimonadales bacterium]|nr:hypothetical protein [Candidatus Saccharimonadales bacterium]